MDLVSSSFQIFRLFNFLIFLIFCFLVNAWASKFDFAYVYPSPERAASKLVNMCVARLVSLVMIVLFEDIHKLIKGKGSGNGVGECSKIAIQISLCSTFVMVVPRWQPSELCDGGMVVPLVKWQYEDKKALICPHI